MEHLVSFGNDAWGLLPRLAMPDLVPPAVMFSLFEEDPRGRYRAALQKLSGTEGHTRAASHPALTPAMMHQLVLRAAWDSVFREVRGDRMGMLCQHVDVMTGTSADAPRSSVVLIKSTDPPGRRWLATRATEYRGKTVCWCVPFDAVTGDRVDMELNRENMTTLDAL